MGGGVWGFPVLDRLWQPAILQYYWIIADQEPFKHENGQHL